MIGFLTRLGRTIRRGALDVSKYLPDPPAARIEVAELLESKTFDGPLEQIPRTRAEVYRVFGDPGTVASPSKAWERERMVLATGLPGQWNGGKGRLYVHRLAEPYLREALRRSELVAPGLIQRIGAWNMRHQRHDSGLPLSYHRWGIAFDLDPAQNRALRFGAGLAPAPFTVGWREFWPSGLPREVVEAWESVGFRWGGRWKSFVDPMHFELVG